MNADLLPVCRRSFRQNKRTTDYLSREVLLVDHVMERAGEFDLIHFHTSCLHYLICRNLPVPHVTTLQGRLDTPELLRLRNERALLAQAKARSANQFHRVDKLRPAAPRHI
jgi:hypothetical protein